jgi:hypothetical protein
MSFVAFVNQFDRIIGLFDIHFSNIQISQEKISELFDLVQIKINQPFKETGKIKIYDAVEHIQNILGEIGVVEVDLNLSYYGVDYCENVLGEWSETYEPRLAIFNNGKSVFLEQEGSVSIFQSFLHN